MRTGARNARRDCRGLYGSVSSVILGLVRRASSIGCRYLRLYEGWGILLVYDMFGLNVHHDLMG